VTALSVSDTIKTARLGAKLGERPDRLVRAACASAPFGSGVLGGIAAASARYPEATAIRTDQADLTYAQLWRRSGQLAAVLRDRGLASEDKVALLARNDVFFVMALTAGARLGCDVVLLNTSMAAPQIASITDAEGVALVLHDDALASLTAECGSALLGSADAMAVSADGGQRPVPPPRRASDFIVLTSGTTGRPKGARRPSAGAGTAAARAFAARIPWGVRKTVVVPAPFFHSWGLAALLISLSLSCTVVTRPEFDARTTLEDMAASRADLLMAVPVMLQRIADLDPGDFVRNDVHSLRGIISSGSSLPPAVTTDVLNRFGPVLYNVYGSTEVAACTIAGPRDLRHDPATAGRPAPGVRVEVVDAEGNLCLPGVVGQVFVGSAMRFDGYTSGEGKPTPGRLLASGDLGRFDSSGRLTIVGRKDDMIVSGGENVHPVEVEDLLLTHPAVADVAVVGVRDAEFGQGLVAFVVLKPGAKLGETEVRAFVKARLARYKVPRTVRFLDELPRTATGKVLRRRLT
jgi:fatty-acyl-CoA synthase